MNKAPMSDEDWNNLRIRAMKVGVRALYHRSFSTKNITDLIDIQKGIGLLLKRKY